jgi:aspartyl-tRNA(Asn)/glutamyl-tRNA(Gln) amidotransferase subunit A
MNPTEARERISRLAHLNAVISLTDETGTGEVVAVKDLIDVRGVPTTGGGAILPLNPAPADAVVIARLRGHGCLMIGKTNMHEWAYGVTSENRFYGNVLNPRDTSRVAGGSSGGSAVAAATGMCEWAIGTDTGGSIRIPAALCGVCGIKPSFGLIPTGGVLPLSRTLDTLGPIAPDLATAVHGLELMSGLHDLLPKEPPPASSLRLAVPANWVVDLDEETARAWRIVSAGLPEIPFPERDRMSEASLGIMLPEASAVHQRWLESCPERYGDPDVLDRLRQGLLIPAADYLSALEDRERLRAEVEAAMHGWDAVLLPACAKVAPLVGEVSTREPLTRFTRAFNVTGQPVVCLPGPTSGLPVGIQVVGSFGDEAGVIRTAAALAKSWDKLARSPST